MGAPQVTIETITVTRPLKVIAFTCCVITVILMVGATSTSDWMVAEGWREGLFMQCVSEGAPTPLPFEMAPVVGCGKARSAHYLNGCAALVVFGLITDFFGTVLTCLGLKSTDPNKKYKYYRVSIYALILAGVFLLLAVIIYPVQFSKDLDNEPEYDGGVVISGDMDLDNDQIPNHLDDDDDGDGIMDVDDPDDDNDGIPDEDDLDDDNDGVTDSEDGDDEDFDNDGEPDNVDTDDDNDGIPDDKDLDHDNDGIENSRDIDDDNDGIPDMLEEDADGDGIVDGMEGIDSDNDGTPDHLDNDDDGDGIEDSKDGDDDGDGIDDSEEEADADGDGTPDAEDQDDDNDGIPDSAEDGDNKGSRRVYSFGFGYGATWGSIILIFASVVLLICDRESEEIFYKERQIEEDEEEEAGEA